MKDERGLYYYPFPANKRARMYVQKKDGAIFFRLWDADDPKLWEDHGWIPYEAVKEATAMYEGKGFDPARAYDIDIAVALIEESGDDSI
jgi:hypothetical protein